jgi:hypothetical protein
MLTFTHRGVTAQLRAEGWKASMGSTIVVRQGNRELTIKGRTAVANIDFGTAIF